MVDSISRDKRDAPPGQAPPYADKSAHEIKDNLNEVKLIVKQMQAESFAQKQVSLVLGQLLHLVCVV